MTRANHSENRTNGAAGQLVPVTHQPTFKTAHITVYQGDALATLRALPDASVDCCVTSPPYWGLRDYGTATWDGGSAECDHKGERSGGNLATWAGNTRGEGHKQAEAQTVPFKDTCGKCGARRIDSQLGLEPTPALYVEKMVEVFREVRRVLRPQGTVFLNLGDSYAGSWGAQGRTGSMAERSVVQARSIIAHPKNISRTGSIDPDSGLKPKDMVGIPWRVAFALQADGWYLRSDIIWAKPNPMPESVTDRPTKSHEYVFMLSKSPTYFFDQEAVKEDAVTAGEVRGGGHRYVPDGENDQHNRAGLVVLGQKPASSGRNIRTVWTIATRPYPEAHFATFPRELPERCIKAGCPEQVCVVCGTVIYRGTGTTPVRGVRDSVRADMGSAQEASALLLEDVRESRDGSDEGDNEGVRANGAGLHLPVSADPPDGDADRLRPRASSGNGSGDWSEPAAERSGRSHQRHQGRQPARELARSDEGATRRNLEPRTSADGDMPEVWESLPSARSCGQCGADLTAPGAIRPGVVLDVFAGSGTTLAVARDLGRKSIGIELSPEYVRLIEKRCAQQALELGA